MNGWGQGDTVYADINFYFGNIIVKDSNRSVRNLKKNYLNISY